RTNYVSGLVGNGFSLGFSVQVLVWERGRPARRRADRRAVLIRFLSRFALIAGGAPAVPASHLIGFPVADSSTSPSFFLCLQQLLLSLQAPAITTQTLVFANNAVTWNHQCHRIRGAGASHRAHGLSLPNSF